MYNTSFIVITLLKQEINRYSAVNVANVELTYLHTQCHISTGHHINVSFLLLNLYVPI